MEIRYRIVSLEETGFHYKPDFNYSKYNILDYDFNISHSLKVLPNDNLITLSMSVYIVSPKGQDILAQEDIFCTFEVLPFDKVINQVDGGFTTTSPDLIDTFVSIAIGALRGLMCKNLKNTSLDGCILPLISMKAIRDNVSNLLKT